MFFTNHLLQIIRFVRVCSNLSDFNIRIKCLTAKILQNRYPYHKFCKVFLTSSAETQSIYCLFKNPCVIFTVDEANR